MWLLTSVDDATDDQIRNRIFGFGVDESSDQDIIINEFEKEKVAIGEVDLPANEDVLVCCELIQMIKATDDGRERLLK
ncbi:MAG: hypothetical protein WCE81_05885 [Halobacteriota archaeon]